MPALFFIILYARAEYIICCISEQPFRIDFFMIEVWKKDSRQEKSDKRQERSFRIDSFYILNIGTRKKETIIMLHY
jgi:hypothetical protein